MLSTPTIAEIDTDAPDVFAFRITGTVTSEDFTAMAERMNTVFDAREDVAMLLIFEDFEGRETGAAMNWPNARAQVRSLSKVTKYATIGAPEGANAMIEAMDNVIPVKARAFDRAEADEAWAFVDARPA